RRRHTRSKRDWSSDVCSSDLKTFPSEPISDEKFAARSFRRKAGGSYRPTIPRWSFVFLPIFLQTSGWRKHFQREKIFTAGLRPRSEERRVGKECRARWWRGYW